MIEEHCVIRKNQKYRSLTPIFIIKLNSFYIRYEYTYSGSEGLLTIEFESLIIVGVLGA